MFLSRLRVAGGLSAGDRRLVAFVREVKAALLGAQAVAAERGLVITSARLQCRSTLTSGPDDVLGGSAGLGVLFLDVAQFSFHREHSDTHELDVTFHPPAAAEAGPAAAEAGPAVAEAGPEADRRGPRPRGPEPAGQPAGPARATAVQGTALARQMSAIVGSVAEVAGTLYTEAPACTPVGAAAAMTLNVGVDRGGTIQLVLGGRRDVQTTHTLTLTFGTLGT